MPQLTTLTLIIKKPSSFFFLTFIDLFAGGGLHVLQRSAEVRGQLSKLLFSSQQMSVPAKLLSTPKPCSSFRHFLHPHSSLPFFSFKSNHGPNV